MFEIVKPGTHVDFLKWWRPAMVASLLLILVGVLAIPVRGFRLGLDFAGGTEVQVRFAGDGEVGEGDVRDALSGVDVPNPSVIRFGEPGSGQYLIKFQGERRIEGAEEGGRLTAESDRIIALQEALEREFGALEVQRVEFVGPKVGAELREDGLTALGIAFLLILVYITVRFSSRFAPGAVAALLHDVLLTSGIWVLLGLEFDLRVLAALLAIVGYSLNDTIIVYDRIRENLELRTRTSLAEVLNLSINQTLSRTLLTSGTTMLAVLSLLFLGGEVIRPFALAMAIGIVVGTYSSIYIAAPVLLVLERRAGESGSKPGRGAGRGGGAASGAEGKARPAPGGKTGGRPGGGKPTRGGGKGRRKAARA